MFEAWVFFARQSLFGEGKLAEFWKAVCQLVMLVTALRGREEGVEEYGVRERVGLRVLNIYRACVCIRLVHM